MATDEDIFATLAEQRMPPADWYKKKSTTEEAKGLLRVFLSEDPTLSKFCFLFLCFFCVFFLCVFFVCFFCVFFLCFFFGF